MSPNANTTASLCRALLLGLLLQTALGTAALGAPPSALPAAQEQPDGAARQPAGRTPPPVAREACVGKKEGDPCRFITPGGPLEGECLSGAEQIFACRPNRATTPAARRTADTSEAQPPETSHLKLPTAEPVTKPAPAKAAVTSEPPPTTPSAPAAPDRPPVPPQAPPAATAVEQPPASLISLPPGTAVSYLLVALLSAGLTWIAYFRRSTMPLRRLRSVTQQLAQGNLAARVGEGLVQRKDEVADLARDVDRMAERIEGLVNAHQRLVRDVSHELRSPLARLNVALELARQTAGPDLAAPFDRIDRESERLNELIAQLLMLTKLENDSSSMQHQQLDLAALITEIAHDVDFEASSKGRRVTATASEPLLLDANRELLRQALENLIRNAARYTAQDTSVEVTLRCRSVGGRNWAHIEVRDYGPGVPESELYDIFRPFYRVNDARERQSGGSGVGLAIADRAVRLHGGSLRAFNAPGGGLVMELELPIT